MSTFGRLLEGKADELIGFEQSAITLDDPQVVAISGKSNHVIVKFNSREDSRVAGTVFEITDEELLRADQYECAPYERVAAMLASGKQAWVYADARLQPDSGDSQTGEV